MDVVGTPIQQGCTVLIGEVLQGVWPCPYNRGGCGYKLLTHALHKMHLVHTAGYVCIKTQDVHTLYTTKACTHVYSTEDVFMQYMNAIPPLGRIHFLFPS